MFGAGSIETRLGIDLGPYEAGMRKAASEAHGLANGVSSAMGGFASKVSNLIRSPIAQIGAAIGAAFTVHEISSQISATMESIDAMAKSADVAGMTTEAYIGLAHGASLAGVESASLEMGLRKLQTNLVDATAGAGEAGDALARMGLNASSLLSAGPEAAIGNIADALNRLPSAAERSAAAAKIFGERAGPQLLNLLSAGSEGLAQARDEAEKLGITLSRVDAAKVEQANDAMSKVGEVLQGIKNQLAVALAPYLQGLAEKLTEISTAGGGIGPKVGAAVEWVAMAVAKAADAVSLFSAAWYGVKAVVLATTAQILSDVSLVGGAVADVINAVKPGTVQWGPVLEVMAGSVRKDAQLAAVAWAGAIQDFATGSNATAVQAWFDQIKAASQSAAEATAANAAKMGGAYEAAAEAMAKSIRKIDDAIKQAREAAATAGLSDTQKTLIDNLSMADLNPAKFLELMDALANADKAKGLAAISDQMKELQDQVDNFGLSEIEVKIKAFGQIPGVSQDQLNRYKELADQLKGLDANKKLDDQAKSIIESIQTPLEKFNEQMDLLNQLHEKGKLSDEQFDRASKQAEDALGGDQLQRQEQKVAFVDARSAEAQAMRFGNSSSNPMAGVIKEQKTGNGYLRNIEQAMTRLDVGPVVEV